MNETFKTFIILLIISKPNPIIVLLIIQNLFLVEKQAKTWLQPQSMLIFPVFNCLFLGKFRRLRDVRFCGYSPNSRCCPSSCILAVLAIFLGISSPISSSQNAWNVLSLNCTALPKKCNLISDFSPIFWQSCCSIEVIIHRSQTSSKFGQF